MKSAVRGKIVQEIIIGFSDDDKTLFSARRKGLTIKLVRRMKNTDPRTNELVPKGRVDVRSVVIDSFPLEQAVEAFKTTKRREGMKAIVKC